VDEVRSVVAQSYSA